ncbi:MAG: biopolymer transporter ExbD [Gammaproteobacteria bacterium]|jgi:biopolymer transport protein TolR
MPSNSQRNRSGRSRRMVNEINVVPYIDVMLVLLVIFMVTAPMLPPGSVDLPTAGRSNTRTDAYIEVQVREGGELRVRTVNTGESQSMEIRRGELAATVEAMRASPEMPVAISADKSLPYETVMDVLGELQRMNVRTALMVKPAG